MSPDSPIIIIGCGAKKLSHQAPAGALYVGPVFNSSIRWARSVAPIKDILIISAKYGLIPVTRVIEPYDVKMGEVGSISSWELESQVNKLGFRSVVVVAGLAYRDILRSAGLVFDEPFAGLSMGYLMQALKKQFGVIPSRRVSLRSP